jgi:glutamate-1-semialdehyde 2,1-aminomutase
MAATPMARKRTAGLNLRAQRVFPCKQSNFRKAAPGPAIFLERGQGTRVWDVDGKDYIDLVLGMGPAIWGHGHAEYEAAVREQLGRLFSVASSTVHTETELELAERIVEHVPCAEQIRFGISGSEANQLVMRLARAFTGRRYFLRFAGHYHGWLDNVFGGELNTDPDAQPFAVDLPGPAGRTEGRGPHADRESYLVPWNDAGVLERVLDRHHRDIAVVLMEPIMCNTGCCPPRPGYLQSVRELCDYYSVLLCFDEVITGFRVGLAGAQGHFGVTPDLAIFGKALAGGLPLSAVAGRSEVMSLLRDGKVLGGGTFNSFPLAMAGGLASVRMLERDGGAWFRNVDRIQQKLMAALRAAAARHGHALLLQGPRGVFYYDFIDCGTAWSPVDLQSADAVKTARFRSLALDHGLLLGGGNRMIISGVMTDAELADTITRFDRVMECL